MIIDREEDTHHVKLVSVYSTLSAKKGVSVDSKLESSQILLEYLWLQQLGISHIKALRIVKLVWFPQPQP